MQAVTTGCKRCGAEIDALDVFPGGICIECHEKKFNAQVARNGGVLPRPDFSKILNTQQKGSIDE
jgi:hypothetical protein